MNSSDRHTRLRNILGDGDCLYCPSVFDPLSARMAEDLGFSMGIVGGSVASLSILDAPDVNILSISELSGLVARICLASDLPLIVDADHGYGKP